MPNPYEDYGLLDFFKDAHILSGGPMTRLQHGAYPDIIKNVIERQYPDIGPRVDRGVLDMAINYAGGYDWAARSGLDPQIAKEQARAYQYMDYGDRPEDSVQDYYENVAGIDAFSGQRVSDEELARMAVEYARQKYSKR